MTLVLLFKDMQTYQPRIEPLIGLLDDRLSKKLLAKGAAVNSEDLNYGHILSKRLHLIATGMWQLFYRRKGPM